MGSFFLVNLCLVVITMQFQETKAREIELMENSKDESPLKLTKPLRALFQLIRKFCNCKPSQEEEHVHHHHHHIYHHHHFHHHLYNCFVPPSPVSDSTLSPPSEVPRIKIEKEGTLSSPPNTLEESGVLQDFLTPPEQTSRRSSKTSVCSHTLSIHAETSSAVSIDEIVAQAKASVTLNIPSPTTGYFSFTSSNSASRKNSCSGKTEVSASTTVLAEINPQHAHDNTSHVKDTERTKESKEARKISLRKKDRELLKHRRFSQPAHVKLTRARPPGISSYNPSELYDKEVGNFSKSEIDPEMVNINFLSPLDSDADETDTERDTALKELASERQDGECQPKDDSSRGAIRPSLKRRNISSQSEDDMFESLFNLRQSATYDVTTNHGAWQRLRIFCRKIAESKQFTFFIMSAIFLNMICMGLEHYQQVMSDAFCLETASSLYTESLFIPPHFGVPAARDRFYVGGNPAMG